MKNIGENRYNLLTFAPETLKKENKKSWTP